MADEKAWADTFVIHMRILGTEWPPEAVMVDHVDGMSRMRYVPETSLTDLLEACKELLDHCERQPQIIVLPYPLQLKVMAAIAAATTQGE